MDDYLWRESNRTIAKYVSADEIEINTIARVNSDEVCGYEENGIYVGTYSTMSPNLKPKPGIVSKLLMKKTPRRDHLFVSKGPHKLIMKTNSKWGSREEANILAIITATTPADHIHKLFTIARESPGGIITASELISAVEIDISVKFQSYVLSLNNPQEFETKDDFVRIEHQLRQIAEDEFSKIGVIVQSVAINYGDSENDKLIDLQSEADREMETGILGRTISSAKKLSSTAVKMDSLTDSIENKAIIEAHGELADRAAARHAREVTAASERELSRRIRELERESISNEKIRDEARKVQEQKAILDRALSLKETLPSNNKDGAESDEE